MLKSYVEFLYPGFGFTENSVRGIEIRDPSKINAPKECFGFRFFDREEIVQGKEVLAGKAKNYSGTFLFGKVYTLEDIKREFPDKKTIINNLEINRYEMVVRTRLGNFQPLELEDRVLSEE